MESSEGKAPNMSRFDNVSTKQWRIAELAKDAPDMAMDLSHHMDLEWFVEAYRRTRKNGALGIDGQSAQEYAENLEENLRSLLDRAKSGRYRAPAVRRVHIPKDAEGKETRPIGIPTFEDKVLQRAVAMALEPVYEQDFLDCSYGFRPRRSAHQAIAAVRSPLMGMGGGFIIDLDIRKYFDTISHQHIQSIFRKRVRDGVLVRLIGKWLNAGVMEDDLTTYQDTGVPQGGVISPILSNIYLHEVLDGWFEEVVKPRLRGKSSMVRFADDAVLMFERLDDAERMMDVLPKRFAKYGLTLHPEKTRLVFFKKPMYEVEGTKRTETFNFLGFTHFWAKSRNGYWVIKHKTAKDRLARSLTRLSVWLRKVRHEPIAEQHKKLCSKVRGHIQYYGIRGNSRAISCIVYRTHLLWKKWLSRRSRKAKKDWRWFNGILERFPLPKPVISHSC
jgi:group II intron reverse transcriptase/maturase